MYILIRLMFKLLRKLSFMMLSALSIQNLYYTISSLSHHIIPDDLSKIGKMFPEFYFKLFVFASDQGLARTGCFYLIHLLHRVVNHS